MRPHDSRGETHAPHVPHHRCEQRPGRAFPTAALDAGHTVVGTVRKPDQMTAFEQLAPDRAHARMLNVTDTDAVAPTVAAIENERGPIDVLVNNAGYGVRASSCTRARSGGRRG
ncbi:SDR family NAD(P)-dependent oxidoreductase [Streptomyces sp. NPDC048304]|uniref:SDR family NAD(P)-dependent oxidoreductase n=1 Tax=Streptomyces sp. NPDC048304 TaxID=3154820 RepID=UPI0033D91123